MKRHRYTDEELDAAALRDLLNDAAHAEAQAENGPFFPNVTAESLRKYAAECRAKAQAHASGGAHAAVLEMR